jgi:hypothetical protein
MLCQPPIPEKTAEGHVYRSEVDVYREKAYRGGGKADLSVLAADGEIISSARC